MENFTGISKPQVIHLKQKTIHEWNSNLTLFYCGKNLFLTSKRGFVENLIFYLFVPNEDLEVQKCWLRFP